MLFFFLGFILLASNKKKQKITSLDGNWNVNQELANKNIIRICLLLFLLLFVSYYSYYKKKPKFISDPLFSASFDEAISKFEDRLSADWIVKRINNDETIIAVLRNPASNDWIVHTTGIHGVEGYTGSAIQLRILDELKGKNINKNIMLVHALNPHGMRHMQRVNANNVDLNRNSILNNDFTSDTIVFKNKWLDTLINPKTLVEFYLFPFLLIYALVGYGIKTSVQLIVTGQYQKQTAMSYGGVEHEPEIKEFYRAIAPFFTSQSKITHMDIHTGFGKYRNEYLMVDTKREQTFFRNFFGKANYYINSEFAEYKNMKGGLINGYQQLLELYGTVQIESYHGMVQEFGTVNFAGIPIFINMRWANFLRFCNSADDKWCRKNMYEAFNPPCAEFQEQTISRGYQRFSELLLS